MPTVQSPEADITVDLSLGGTVQTMAISNEGRQLIKPSPLRLTDPVSDGSEGNEEVSIISISRTERQIHREFSTVTGKQREHTYRATESVFSCDLSNGQRLEFYIRVSANGVAFRLRFPDTSVLLTFQQEAGIRFPRRTISWLSPYATGHETDIHQTSVFDAAGTFSMPGLFKIYDDQWVLLTEADVDGSFMPSQLGADPQDDRMYFQHPEFPVRTTSGFEIPWRVIVLGSLETVVESDLVPALVEGSQIDDTDWIEPGRVAWSWWSEWDSAANPDRQKDYIDYASARDWEYVLIDEGWEAEWMPDVVEYAAAKDVGVFIWTHWTDLYDPEEREVKLSRWKRWGVDGIKIDVMDANEQGRMQFYDQLLQATAEYELMVNFHSSLLPTGMKARWPHVLTYEAVKGAEHYEWATLTPTHNTVLPYMRNVVGPMDYTPVTLSAENRHTTVGHELALSVVYESGLQHFADSIDEYAARPHAEWFLERVPAVWDETRFIAGQPGTGATIARRSGGEWFVGSITAGGEQTIDVPLSFLSESRTGTILQDDDTGEVLRRDSLSVDPADELSISVRPNGGFCIYLPQ
ncbi:glycoside hydrolase family 97 protein [Halorhabdus rudnickae]|uniref:glycoside hydrolase family 97 protein n=1 Tax=Halorhabdus rudnickae TaxID=1775544 RepID=UPI001082C8FD|nr:glycoside hydrolase family 97 protein [Halorhabdus rudnickae]